LIEKEAQKAFDGKDWQVNIRWIVTIAVNVSLVAWVAVSNA
jgi:hypothetical protein